VEELDNCMYKGYDNIVKYHNCTILGFYFYSLSTYPSFLEVSETVKQVFYFWSEFPCLAWQ